MIRPARSHVAGAGSPTTTTLRDWFLDSLLKTTVMWSILWLIVNLTAAVASFPLVALGFSEPRDWRPVFGPFREAYTLRNYWGLFWHQLSRDFFSRPAEFVAHRVLGLSRTSGRWHVMHLKVLLTFAVSGMAHVFIDLSTGVEFGQSRSMEFFLLQACAIIFEDYVRLSLGDDKVTRPPQGWSLPVRMLGFVWVALWFTWTTPYWIELRSAVDDGIPALPFSVVSPVLRLISGGGER